MITDFQKKVVEDNLNTSTKSDLLPDTTEEENRVDLELSNKYAYDELLQDLEMFCRKLFAKAVKLERISLAQRARINWLRDGDQCTAFFFKKLTVRRVMSKIYRIEDSNATELTEPQLIRDEIIGYYSNLMGKSSRSPGEVLPDFERFISRKLTDEDAMEMVRPVNVEKIKSVLFNFPDDKAPGPDGFTVGFF
ncbi:hypothetical protein BUALT_Bualt14G0066100 [Buddleja alternifolia]|uniref:Reverse transcriptase n=1 Tax=Buddleja alternifolia TaxID=168488 RepID=A0AAV6WPG7_9LAMI|nr:hypothetical protein BUALT_Bualt14G0066100 [Buddleja alternifolia]